MKTSWRRLSSSSTKDVFKTSWSRRIYWPYSCVFRRRLQDVLIKTNVFLSVIRLQDVFKTFSRRLAKTSSKRLQDVLQKTSSRDLDVCKTFSKHFQDVFKTSSRRLAKTFSRRFEKVLQKRLQDIFKASSRRFEDVFKTSCKDVFKICSRRIIELICSCWNVFKMSLRRFQNVSKT